MSMPVFPWLTETTYFNAPREYSLPFVWFTGTWLKQNTYLNGSPLPDRVATRTFDAAGRVVRVDVMLVSTQKTRTFTLTYDAKGRLSRYADTRSDTYEIQTVKYDSVGRINEEARELQRPGQHAVKTVARNRFSASGRTTDVTSGGVRAERRKFNKKGDPLEMLTYGADGQSLFQSEISLYDSRNRLKSRTTKIFMLGGTSADFDATEESFTYFGGSRRLRKAVTSETIPLNGARFEHGRRTTDYLEKAFPDNGDRQIHAVASSFEPGNAGSPVETLRYTDDWHYDSTGTLTTYTQTGTRFADNVTRTNRTRYFETPQPDGGIEQRELLDLGADGTDDEELVTIADVHGATVESRTNVPPGGSFLSRRVLKYTLDRQLFRSETYENNSTTSKEVIENVYATP